MRIVAETMPKAGVRILRAHSHPLHSHPLHIRDYHSVSLLLRLGSRNFRHYEGRRAVHGLSKILGTIYFPVPEIVQLFTLRCNAVGQALRFLYPLSKAAVWLRLS